MARPPTLCRPSSSPTTHHSLHSTRPSVGEPLFFSALLSTSSGEWGNVVLVCCRWTPTLAPSPITHHALITHHSYYHGSSIPNHLSPSSFITAHGSDYFPFVACFPTLRPPLPISNNASIVVISTPQSTLTAPHGHIKPWYWYIQEVDLICFSLEAVTPPVSLQA